MVREQVDSKEIENLAAKCKKLEESSDYQAIMELSHLVESLNDLKQEQDALHAEFRLAKAQVK